MELPGRQAPRIKNLLHTSPTKHRIVCKRNKVLGIVDEKPKTASSNARHLMMGSDGPKLT